MNEVYIIEECLAPGVWVLLSDTFYTDRGEADRSCDKAMETMKKYKKDFIARVTKLERLNK